MESAGEKLRTSAFMWFGFPILSCRISLPAFLLYLYSPHRKHKYEHYYFIRRSHSFGSTNKVLLFAMLVECKMVVFCDTVAVISFSNTHKSLSPSEMKLYAWKPRDKNRTRILVVTSTHTHTHRHIGTHRHTQRQIHYIILTFQMEWFRVNEIVLQHFRMGKYVYMNKYILKCC